jgi:hypothetical protein
MVEFNVLTESFIVNTSGAGTEIPLDSVQVRNLLRGEADITLSGGTVALLIDLGAQKDVDRFDYTFNPATSSGVTISYGREADNLIVGTPTVVGQTVRVLPTASGFSYPRFFKLEHIIPSGSPATLSGLAALNNDEDVDFGEDGTLTSFPITGNQSTETTVYELYVKNDGSIPTDVYVSLETAEQDFDTLERFYLAPTSTGTFVNFDTDIEVPTSVPWEWGVFEDTIVSDDNQLSVTNPANTASSLTEGSELSLIDLLNKSEDGKLIQAKNALGEDIIVSPRSNHSFHLMNIFSNSAVLTATPSHYSPSNDEEEEWLHPAWDGGDKIYYLNGKDTQEVQVYEISTNTFSTAISGLSFYNRRLKTLFYDDGDLIVMGSRSTAGSSTSVGTDCWRVNIETGAETALQSMPNSENGASHSLIKVDNLIYFSRGVNERDFYRYNIDTDQWEILESLPSVDGFNGGIMYNRHDNTIWWRRTDRNVYEFNITTGHWNSTPLFTDTFETNYTVANLFFDSSVYYVAEMQDGTSNSQEALVVHDPIQLGELASPISGSWISPVFKVQDGEEYRRILLEMVNIDKVQVDFQNLAAPTFEVRGSDFPPSADNFIENYITTLDEDTWATGVFNDVVLTSTDNLLTFSHDGQTDIYSSGYTLLGLPLGTAGTMQYRFWWNPSSNRTADSTNFSGFYIVPFLDILFSGDVPVRDPDSNQRTEDDYIYLKFGADSDSGGVYTALEFYNGSTTSSFPITASTGSFYEVSLVINWTTGDYTLEFSGEQVGTGNIPGFKRNELESQHSIEIFSGAETVDTEEKFKYLSISRVDLDPSSDDDRAFPLHREDPLYGKSGSLEFIPVTLDSPLLPKTDYLQFRITMQTRLATPEQTPGLASLRFPPVLKLEDVGVGESKPVYFYYDFTDTSQTLSTELRLKAWMYTDKT